MKNTVSRGLAAALLLWALGTAQAQNSIVMASTTSTEQSGLFGHLLPAFTKAHRVFKALKVQLALELRVFKVFKVHKV